MTEHDDTKYSRASCWIELANGGGVLFRDPSAPPVSPGQYTRLRQPKQLSGDTSRSLR